MENKEIVSLLIGLLCSFPLAIAANFATPVVRGFFDKRFEGFKLRSKIRELKRYHRIKDYHDSRHGLAFLVGRMVLNGAFFILFSIAGYGIPAFIAIIESVSTLHDPNYQWTRVAGYVIAVISTLVSLVAITSLGQTMNDCRRVLEFDEYKKDVERLFGGAVPPQAPGP